MTGCVASPGPRRGCSASTQQSSCAAATQEVSRSHTCAPTFALVRERDQSGHLEAMDDIPRARTLHLFEVYEADGSLLVVTSDLTSVDRQPGDRIVRRPWFTSDEPAEVIR